MMSVLVNDYRLLVGLKQVVVYSIFVVHYKIYCDACLTGRRFWLPTHAGSKKIPSFLQPLHADDDDDAMQPMQLIVKILSGVLIICKIASLSNFSFIDLS